MAASELPEDQFTQDFRTQRRNYGDGDTRLGDHDRLWYDGRTRTIRVYDGTAGGTIVAGADFISENIDFSQYATFDDLAAAVEATFDDSDYISNAELTTALELYATEAWADGRFLQTHQDISGKADVATTLAGYGIADAYTQTEVDGLLAGKSDTSHNHNDLYYLKTETYTRDEINALVVDSTENVTDAELVAALGNYYTQAEVDGLFGDSTDHVSDQDLLDGVNEAKAYTDTAVAGLIDGAPDTLNTLNELAAAVADNEDFFNVVNGKVSNTGDTMTGALDMNTVNKIINLATPTADGDAATKGYVDAQITASAPVGYNNTNWDTAYSWGNHALAGYATLADLNQDSSEELQNWAEDSAGNLLPDADNAYDIGSPTQRVRELYVSSSSVHIGDYVLSESAGVLHWNGSAVAGDGSLHIDSHNITVNSAGVLELDGSAIATEAYVDALFGDSTDHVTDAELTAALGNYYTQAEVDGLLLDSTAYIDQAELDAATAGLAPMAYVDASVPDLTPYATQTWVESFVGDSTDHVTDAELTAALAGKADTATTLAGYGIDDAYTQAEVDSAIAAVVMDSTEFVDHTELTAGVDEAKAYTDAEIIALVGGAPGALDTLNELAEAIQDNTSSDDSSTTWLQGLIDTNATAIAAKADTTYVNAQIASVTLDSTDYVDHTELTTALGDYTLTSNLSTVATSGLFSDLSDKDDAYALTTVSQIDLEDENYHVTFVTNFSGSTSDEEIKVDGNDTFMYNPTTETLTVNNVVINGSLSGIVNYIGDFSGDVWTPTKSHKILESGTDGTDALLTGNVTGDVTGNVTGNVTGDVTGNVTGNVTGDVTGTVSSIVNHDLSDLGDVDLVTENPVEGEVLTWNDAANGSAGGWVASDPLASLATVATSGSYNDLSDKPAGLEGHLIGADDTKVEVVDASAGGVVEIHTAGTHRWTVTELGHLIPNGNALYDIGEAENKVRSLYLHNATITLGEGTLSQDVATGKLQWDNDGDSTEAAYQFLATEDYVDASVPDLTPYATQDWVITQVGDSTDHVTDAELTAAVTDMATQTWVNGQAYLVAADITGKADTTYVDLEITTAIDNLIDSAPGTLDTLGELAAALEANDSSDDSTATWLQGLIDTNATAIAGKADVGVSYTKAEADGNFLTAHQDISGKADVATTLAGYGIADAYTQAEVDARIPASQDAVTLAGSYNYLTLSGQEITLNQIDPSADIDRVYVGSGVGHNTYIGDSNSVGNTNTGDSNVTIGYQAGHAMSSASHNVLLGREAGHDITTGDYNILIGSYTGDVITTGSQNIAIGYQALSGYASTSQNRAIAIGYSALGGTGGGYSVAVGGWALAYDAGFGNTAIGQAAGLHNSTGNDNIYIGNESGSDGTSWGSSGGSKSGSSSISIGSGTHGDLTTGNRSIAIGTGAGDKITTGNENLSLGVYAGDTTTTGSNNTVIGNRADTSSATAENETVIGHSATGNGDNTVTLGNYSVSSVHLGGHSGSQWMTFRETVPTSSKGASGDIAGMVAMDDDYMYYCYADWTDGTPDIWTREAWTKGTW